MSEDQPPNGMQLAGNSRHHERTKGPATDPRCSADARQVRGGG
jgi:hypothetical protein